MLNCIKIRSLLLAVMQANGLARPPYRTFILWTVGTCVELEQKWPLLHVIMIDSDVSRHVISNLKMVTNVLTK
jgi:hypothetical protein